MLLGNHIRTFTDFAESHYRGDIDHDYHIRLKFEHSLRVLDDAQAITQGESITGDTADLAALAALYHDIGRFPQYSRYGTFKDAESTNHGRLAVLTLRDIELPQDVTPKQWCLVRAAIGLHNVKTTNPATRAPLETIAGIVRDADKLDIFNIILDHLDPDAESKPVVIHSLIEDPVQYSEDVYRTTFEGKIGNYHDLRYSNDFILLLIGWVHTLNFTASLRLLHERNMVENAFTLLPDNGKMKALKTKIDNFMRYKLC